MVIVNKRRHINVWASLVVSSHEDFQQKFCMYLPHLTQADHGDRAV
jgi:hypothetical protein